MHVRKAPGSALSLARDHDLSGRLCQEQLQTGRPPWLFLDHVTLIPVSE
jgi:hypothetical protein